MHSHFVHPDVKQIHQENGMFRSGHSGHSGKWSERSEWSALESGQTTYLRSVKTLGEWFNLFQSRPSALRVGLPPGPVLDGIFGTLGTEEIGKIRNEVELLDSCYHVFLNRVGPYTAVPYPYPNCHAARIFITRHGWGFVYNAIVECTSSRKYVNNESGFSERRTSLIVQHSSVEKTQEWVKGLI
ncbi:hypothetical protein JOM56_014348 [Amanita muscaria]